MLLWYSYICFLWSILHESMNSYKNIYFMILTYMELIWQTNGNDLPSAQSLSMKKKKKRSNKIPAVNCPFRHPPKSLPHPLSHSFLSQHPLSLLPVFIIQLLQSILPHSSFYCFHPCNPFEYLSRPVRWDRFFVIPLIAPYSDCTHIFQQCLQKEVGKVSIYSLPDHSRLVKVTSESIIYPD